MPGTDEHATIIDPLGDDLGGAYRAALSALQVAYDELENVDGLLSDALHCRGYVRDQGGFPREGDRDVDPPTFADLGELWAFTDDVKAQLEQLEMERLSIVERLHALNMARLDREAKRRHVELLRQAERGDG